MKKSSAYSGWSCLAFLLLFAALLLSACGRSPAPSITISPTPSPNGPLGGEQALAIARRFDEQGAMDIVRTLAAPSFMGRHVGTEGEARGAKFLAEAFEKAGLTPGGDDRSFIQSFSLEVEELAAPPVLELIGATRERSILRLRDDFRPIYGGSAGAGDVEGPGLFAGSGDDFSRLDARGKVVVVVPRGSLADIVARGRSAGAIAVIATTGRATLFKSEGRPPNPDAIPVAVVSQNGATRLLEGSGHTRTELNDDIRAGRPLPSFPLAWTIRLAVSLRPPARVTAHNIIGVLPGEPHAERAVVVGAHFEEIGPDPDGTVYPAANDNASGTAVLVGLARLLAEAGFRPAANIVFVAWSGHEEGLFGSKFYVEHPRYPLAKTSLYLNLDTVGQGAAPHLEAIPSDNNARNSLDDALSLLQGQGESAPVRILENPAGDSDDVNFRRAGVPSIALEWGGLFEDGRIHTPADTADTVDASKLQVTGQLAALLLLLVAR